VLPLQLYGGDLSSADARIDRIRPEGGTDLKAPLGRALQLLTEAGFQNRHALLLTDGEPEDSTGLLEVADELRKNGIQLSTVRISKLRNRELLAELAARGGGRYYQAQDLEELKKAFQEEIQQIVVGVPLADQPFTPVPGPRHVVLKGFTAGEFPRLGGYVGTVLKDRAELVLASHRRDPVLATRRYGLGVGVAFTSDIGGPWSREWVGWERFPQLMGQIVRSTFRPNTSTFTTKATIHGSRGDISIDAVDRTGSYLNFLSLVAQVCNPKDRSIQQVSMVQTGPGRYEGRFCAPDQGLYRVEVHKSGGNRQVDVAGAARGEFPELASGAIDHTVLQRIASRTSGRAVTADEVPGLARSILASAADQGEVHELWLVFALFALLAFFCEVVLRRSRVFSTTGEEAMKDPTVALAERYQEIARDLEARGDAEGAQDHYLRAYSCFVKARREQDARKLWERYRLREERRHGSG
jgi:hypothetical protein